MKYVFVAIQSYVVTLEIQNITPTSGFDLRHEMSICSNTVLCFDIGNLECYTHK
jgi:hypothetical protein